MILRATKYPFGTKITTIQTELFKCMVSTAKEGFFKKQSTEILEVAIDGARRRVGRLIYAASLSSAERLQMHEAIVKGLDGSDGCPLGIALEMICDEMRSRGIASEAINIAT